jgi:AcrR family transcriptional regulator
VASQRSLVGRHPELQPRLGGRREDTARGQRARLLSAMAEVVADQGFERATVTDIVAAAGVSRSTFYEQFSSKEDCFLEAYRHGVEVLLAEVRAAVAHAAGDGWRAQLRAGIRAYLRALAGEPRFARTYLVEIHAAGPAALRARAAAMRRFAERYHASYEQARAEGVVHREPPPDALLLLCAGTEQLFAERLATGGPLDDLEDIFCDCAESVLLGPGVAPTDDEEA